MERQHDMQNKTVQPMKESPFAQRIRLLYRVGPLTSAITPENPIYFQPFIGLINLLITRGPPCTWIPQIFVGWIFILPSPICTVFWSLLGSSFWKTNMIHLIKNWRNQWFVGGFDLRTLLVPTFLGTCQGTCFLLITDHMFWSYILWKMMKRWWKLYTWSWLHTPSWCHHMFWSYIHGWRKKTHNEKAVMESQWVPKASWHLNHSLWLQVMVHKSPKKLEQKTYKFFLTTPPKKTKHSPKNNL